MNKAQQWTKQGPSVTATDVLAVQTALKHKLPKDYVAFVREHNGGVPSLTVFPIKGMPLNPTGEIDRLHSLKHGKHVFDLVESNKRVSHALPGDCISIGHDAGPGQILLYTRGPRAGQVWFLDWYSECEDPEDGTYFVAASFAEFLGALREVTQEELQEIEELAKTHILEPFRKKKKSTKQKSAKPSKTVCAAAPAAKKRRAPPKKP